MCSRHSALSRRLLPPSPSPFGAASAPQLVFHSTRHMRAELFWCRARRTSPRSEMARLSAVKRKQPRGVCVWGEHKRGEGSVCLRGAPPPRAARGGRSSRPTPSTCEACRVSGQHMHKHFSSVPSPLVSSSPPPPPAHILDLSLTRCVLFACVVIVTLVCFPVWRRRARTFFGSIRGASVAK